MSPPRENRANQSRPLTIINAPVTGDATRGIGINFAIIKSRYTRFIVRKERVRKTMEFLDRKKRKLSSLEMNVRLFLSQRVKYTFFIKNFNISTLLRK